MIQLKRVYDPADAHDGRRFLVDRMWPRGIKKESIRLDGWLKDVAPSDALRRWFGHDPARWEEFIRRYGAELEGIPEIWEPLLIEARHGTVTLVYSARDRERNNALALKLFLEERLKKGAAEL
jgi:uncharacterized protein YeaO (DUF488 family)